MYLKLSNQNQDGGKYWVQIGKTPRKILLWGSPYPAFLQIQSAILYQKVDYSCPSLVINIKNRKAQLLRFKNLVWGLAYFCFLE
jgi:hypothetical protein